MTTKDYVFRTLALLIVWTAIGMASIDASLFIITDEFDLAIASLVLAVGLLVTLVIWCGPEFVRWLTGPTNQSRSSEQHAEK